MFFIGGLPALLALFVRYRVHESEVWERTKHKDWGSLGRGILSHWKLFLYLTLLMAGMNFVSHGTQDMYPTFLQRDWGFSPQKRAALTAFSMIGAIIGGVTFGYLSDKIGRRRSIVLALVLAIDHRLGDRRVRYAVHGSGSMGSDSRAHHRAVPGFGAWLSPRLRLPVRSVAGELSRVSGSSVRGENELRTFDGDRSAHRFLGGSDHRLGWPRATRRRVWSVITLAV